MNTFFLTPFRPEKTFGELKTADKFSAMSLIVLLILMLLNLVLLIPVTEKITLITLSSMSLPEGQMDMMIQTAHTMRYVQIVGSAILYVIMFLFYAFLLYLLVRLADDNKLEYKKALQLVIFSYFIVAIGDLVNTALIFWRGLDAIKTMYDVSLTGLNLLTSVEQIGATRYIILSYITPFQLWFVVLLSIGLKILTDMKWVKAIIISALFWLITILIPVISVFLSQVAGGK